VADGSRAASLPIRPIAESAAGAVADGKSTIAVRVDDRHVMTIDAAERRRELTLPPECLGPLLAAGAGRVLIGCTSTPYAFDDRAIYSVLNARTGSVAQVVVPNPYKGSVDGATPYFSRIGDDWLGGRVGFHRGEISFHVNWRTGRQIAGDQDPFGSRRWLDLSAPALGRALCRPFRRPLAVADSDFSPRDRYTTAPQVVHGWVLAPSQGRAGFSYGRCGAPARALGRVDDATLGGGLVSWRAARRASGPVPRPTTTFVRRLDDGRTWTIGGSQDRTFRAGRAIVIARPNGNGVRIMLTRIPGVEARRRDVRARVRRAGPLP